MKKRAYPDWSDLQSGFDFDHYDIARLPSLSDNDLARPISAFYLRGRTQLPPEMEQQYAKGNPMDPAGAILPGHADILLKPEEGGASQGFCVLPNGVGYCSAVTSLDNIPFALFDWYKKVKVKDDLAYRLWYPGSHVSEYGGISVEDVGLGIERLEPVCPITAEALGLSKDPEKADPCYERLMGGCSYAIPVDRRRDAVEPRAVSLIHYVKRLPSGGCRFRTIFYLGALVKNGGLIPVRLPEDPAVTLEVSRQMLSHCMNERYNLITFLPTLYVMLERKPFQHAD